jgi:hypothetical protein
MSDGGKQYVYVVAGMKTVYKVPPKGFKAVDATDAQLARYGLPLRPNAAQELANWTAMMSRLNIPTPGPFVVQVPVSASLYSKVWAGYLGQGGGVTLARGWWNEVSVGNSCTNATALTWAGIGGYPPSTNLAQAGTAVGVQGIGQHQAWWEVTSGSGALTPIQGIYGHAGYYFLTYTQWNYGVYNMYVYDSYSGGGLPFSVYTNIYDGSSADFIIERGQGAGGPTPMLNFYYVNFLGAQVNGTGSSNSLYYYNPASVYAWSDALSRYIAHVDQGVNTSGAFRVHYDNCN